MESFAACLNRSYSGFVACETTLKITNLVSRAWSGNPSESIKTEFSSRTHGGYGWCLSVQSTAGSTDYLDVYLYVKDQHSVQAVFCISIVDSDGCKKCILPQQINQYVGRYCKFDKLLDLQQLRENPKLLRNGDLWLHCEVATEGQFQIPSLKMIADKLKFRLPANDSDDDPAMFLPKHEKLSDVIIVVDNKEIKAHKVMLAMRSPVFAAMFESEMKEQKQNRVVIADMDYQTVQQMLLYVYTGKTPNLSEMADRLLTAADKYSLDGLKVRCQQQLSSTVSMDTVVPLMALAELCNASLLKDKLNEFITENFKGLMSSTAWQKLLYEASYKQHFNNGSST